MTCCLSVEALIRKLALLLAVVAAVVLAGSPNAVAMRHHHHVRSFFVFQTGPLVGY
jgi:hypothetical protein